ncbi:hypothetical protein NM208_g5359 [Fusarium decemcellulare]|uniref:Uncharacterized protein n=1 Tax=Fusarium decemcellulare TaxID=57161 RepID=A0ACC1SH78_9HYPO|nr:hypothetical protein NM208_g5359 [Fusarium decemcellulare]
MDGEPWKQPADQSPQIRAVKKLLLAERQLTLALEEAVSELEAQTAKLKLDSEVWAGRAHQLQSELDQIRATATPIETSAHREDAVESAQRHLEQNIDMVKKLRRNGGSFGCFWSR